MKALDMFEKSTVTNITCEPCYTSQYEYIITLDVKGEAFTIHYIDVGNNAEYDDEVRITRGNDFFNDDNSPTSSALWDWVDENIDNIPNLKVGDVIKLNITDPKRERAEKKRLLELENRKKAQKLTLQHNINKIKARPPSPRPQRRPKFN